MTNLIGICWLKNSLTTHIGMGSVREFEGKHLPVFDRNQHGDVLVLGPSGLASFDAVDVRHFFSCQLYAGYLLPAETDLANTAFNLSKAITKSGGNSTSWNIGVQVMSLPMNAYNMTIFETRTD